MSRVTHTKIIITKNPMLKVPVEVPQWEAHILLALWGDDAQVIGTVVYEREVPEVNDEFTRLANKYGPRDEDIPFVARVYGSFGPGLRGLTKEFEASIAGGSVASVAGPENAEPVEIDRTLLAGFDGSKAPTAPVELDGDLKPIGVVLTDEEVAAVAGIEPLVTRESEVLTSLKGTAFEPGLAESDTAELTDEQLASIEVDSLAGNTIGGVPLETFLEKDVSDLTS